MRQNTTVAGNHNRSSGFISDKTNVDYYKYHNTTTLKILSQTN